MLTELGHASYLGTVLVALSSAFVFRQFHKRRNDDDTTTPLPPYGPELKEFAEAVRTGPWCDFQLQYVKRYGPMMRVKPFFPLNLLLPHQVLIADPKVAKELMVTQAQMKNRGGAAFVERDEFMSSVIQQGEGPSITALVGDEWKWRKDAILKEFTKRKLMDAKAGLVTHITQYCHELCNALEAESLRKNCDTVRVHDFVGHFVGGVIQWLLFASEERAHMDTKRLAKCMNDMIGFAFHLFYTPFHHIQKYFDKDCSSKEQARDAAWAYMDKVLDKDVKGVYASQIGSNDKNVPPSSRTDLDGNDGAMLSIVKGEPRYIAQGFDRLMVDARILMLGGYDTTTHVLAFSMGILAKEKHIGDKIRSEIRNVFGKDGITKDTNITTQHLAACPTAKGLFMEALRLHPPVPTMGGLMKKSIVVTTTGETQYMLPKGTRTTFCFAAMNRSLPRDEHPDDAVPERWSSDDPHDHPFLGSFSIGPHTCPGKNLAMLEGHIALLFLADRFEFDLAPNKNMYEYVSTCMTKPKNGMPLIVKKRV